MFNVHHSLWIEYENIDVNSYSTNIQQDTELIKNIQPFDYQLFNDNINTAEVAHNQKSSKNEI